MTYALLSAVLLCSEPSFFVGPDSWLDTVKDSHVQEVRSSPRTYWYDRQSLPRLNVDTSGKVFRHGFDVSLGRDPKRTGAPNNEKPWLHPGGFDNVRGVTVVRGMLMPPNRKMRVSLIQRRAAGRVVRNWETRFPAGTSVVEFINVPNGYRVVRRRTKAGENDWDTAEYETGRRPPGYVEVANCTDCHEDIGKHAWELDRNRDWYTFVATASEPGGPMHFHPFDASKVTGTAPVWPTINPELVHLVEFEDSVSRQHVDPRIRGWRE